MSYLEEARTRFAEDLFATEATGIVIEEADVNYAKCRLTIQKKHQNAAGAVMGGAIYTLADFTFAVAANTGNPLTVSQTGTVTYLGGAKGKELIAEAKCVKSGRSTCFFLIEVKDELGTLVANVGISGFRKV